MSEGRGVTAKIRWLTKVDEDGEGEGRSRWIHATPLYGHTGAVGVWMVVLVDEEGASTAESRRRFRPAPPVANVIGGKEYDPQGVRDRREREKTNIDRLLPQSQDLRGYTSTTVTSGRSRPQQHIASVGKKGPSSVLSGRAGAGNTSELSFQLR